MRFDRFESCAELTFGRTAAHPRLVELLKTNPVSAPKCKNWGMARAKRAKMLARRQLA